jgi:hypothetical protein
MGRARGGASTGGAWLVTNRAGRSIGVAVALLALGAVALVVARRLAPAHEDTADPIRPPVIATRESAATLPGFDASAAADPARELRITSTPEAAVVAPMVRSEDIVWVDRRRGAIEGLLVAHDGTPFDGPVGRPEDVAFPITVARDEPGGELWSMSAPTAKGGFRVGDLVPGRYTVDVERCERQVVEVRPGETTHLEVRMPRWPILRGRAIRADGKSAVHAEVEAVLSYVRDMARSGGLVSDYASVTARTDDAGEFELVVWAGGEFSISATSFGGGSSDEVRVALGDGEQRSITLRFGAAYIEGLVVDAVTDAPIAGARARLSGGTANGAVFSDAQGEFRIEGLQPGETRLSVGADGHLGMEVEHVIVPTTRVLRVALEPAAIVRGEVRLPDGRPAPDGTLVLSWRLAATGALADRRRTGTTDGKFEIANLEPGRLQLGAVLVPEGREISGPAAWEGPDLRVLEPTEVEVSSGLVAAVRLTAEPP